MASSLDQLKATGTVSLLGLRSPAAVSGAASLKKQLWMLIWFAME
jgi:hypothetical protein